MPVRGSRPAGRRSGSLRHRRGVVRQVVEAVCVRLPSRPGRQPSVAWPTDPLSVPRGIGLPRRCAPAAGSMRRLSLSSIPLAGYPMKSARSDSTPTSTRITTPPMSPPRRLGTVPPVQLVDCRPATPRPRHVRGRLAQFGRRSPRRRRHRPRASPSPSGPRRPSGPRPPAPCHRLRELRHESRARSPADIHPAAGRQQLARPGAD